MRVLVVYRTASMPAVRPSKPRPAFFDKEVCLLSLLRAIEPLGDDVRLVVVSNGELNPALEALARTRAEIVHLDHLPPSPSYRAAVDLALERARQGGEDLVYFAEDDYLYLPDAFTCLVQSAVELPAVSYFSLYDHPDRYTRDDNLDDGRVTVRFAGGRHWRTAESSCLTYAARPEQLRRDRWLHRLASMGSEPKDRFVWRVLQRLGPYRITGTRRRELVTPVPSLATHSSQYLAPAVDWAAVAAATREWARERLVSGS